VYSGTVAGAREAFFYGIPSMSVSYRWVPETSSISDFEAAAQVCLPVINGLLTELKNGTYPKESFLNVEIPTDSLNHKGYKVAKQGKKMIKVGWISTTPNSSVEKTYVAADVEENSGEDSSSSDGLWFKRKILSQEDDKEKQDEDCEDIDHKFLKEGYVTITPLCGLSNASKEDRSFFGNFAHNLSSL
ncbi:5'-nucleotidase, partial [Zostera marina]